MELVGLRDGLGHSYALGPKLEMVAVDCCRSTVVEYHVGCYRAASAYADQAPQNISEHEQSPHVPTTPMSQVMTKAQT